MSDCAICLRCRSEGGGDLGPDKLQDLVKTLESEGRAGFKSTLGDAPSWTIVASGLIVIFQHWDEQAEELVETADGGVGLASYVTIVIDGDEVAVPDLPEGNPPGEELLDRLLELDLELTRSWLAEITEVPAGIELTPTIEHW